MGKITVIFNNICDDKALKVRWGSSAIVEDGKDITLFDVGPRADDLFFNMRHLGFDANAIKEVVISHKHPDHAGALPDFLRENPGTIETYLPPVFDREELSIFRELSESIYVVYQKIKIGKRIYLFPMKGVFKGVSMDEQAIVIDSSQGLIVLLGCAHLNVLRICKSIKKDFGKDIFAVLGGFHLEHHPGFLLGIFIKSLKRLGVQFAGPNHCTGEKAMKNFRKVFKGGFVDFGSGKSFEFK